MNIYKVDNGTDIKTFGKNPMYKVENKCTYQEKKAVIKRVFYDKLDSRVKLLEILIIDDNEIRKIHPIEMR